LQGLFTRGGGAEESATGTASGATGGYLVLNKLVPVKEPVTRIVCEQGYVLKRPSTIHVEVESHDGRITGVRVAAARLPQSKGRSGFRRLSQPIK
jgi:predicted PhzF superfamily epimerase YddE/YHI9